MKIKRLRSMDTFLLYHLEPRYDHSGILYEGKLYIYGGHSNEKTSLSDIWALDIDTLSWKELIPQCPSPWPFSSFPAQVLNNKIFFYGGCIDGKNGFFASNLDTNFWEIKTAKHLGNNKATLFTIYKGAFIINSGQEWLCKQEDETSLKNGMKKLFAEKPFLDIVFKVENEEIPANKAILINRCPYFGKMFQSGMKEAQNSVIDVPNMKAGVFNTLLEYLYCNEIILNEDITLDLFQVAEEYLLPELEKVCEKFLTRNITVKNVFEVARVADLFKAEEILKAVVEFVIKNSEDLFDKNDYRQLPDSIFKLLCKYKSK